MTAFFSVSSASSFRPSASRRSASFA
jgi:hypothetical protein